MENARTIYRGHVIKWNGRAYEVTEGGNADPATDNIYWMAPTIDECRATIDEVLEGIDEAEVTP